MPFLAAPAPTERAGLRTYLEQQLTGIRNTAYGLTEDQIRLAPTRSELTVGGLIKQFGVQSFTGSASVLAVIQQAAPHRHRAADRRRHGARPARLRRPAAVVAR